MCTRASPRNVNSNTSKSFTASCESEQAGSYDVSVASQQRLTMLSIHGIWTTLRSLGASRSGSTLFFSFVKSTLPTVVLHFGKTRRMQRPMIGMTNLCDVVGTLFAVPYVLEEGGDERATFRFTSTLRSKCGPRVGGRVGY